jgi:hypothetical protein
MLPVAISPARNRASQMSSTSWTTGSGCPKSDTLVAVQRSTGIPTMLPHSVQDPS